MRDLVSKFWRQASWDSPLLDNHHRGVKESNRLIQWLDLRAIGHLVKRIVVRSVVAIHFVAFGLAIASWNSLMSDLCSSRP